MKNFTCQTTPSFFPFDSIIIQDHQIKYMRAWLESIFTNCSIFFSCQAIYRRMSCCFSSSISFFLYYFSHPLFSLTQFISTLLAAKGRGKKLSPNEARMENLWLSIYLPYTQTEMKEKKKWTHFDIYCKLQLVDMTFWSIIYVIWYEICCVKP